MLCQDHVVLQQFLDVWEKRAIALLILPSPPKEQRQIVHHPKGLTLYRSTFNLFLEAQHPAHIKTTTSIGRSYMAYVDPELTLRDRDQGLAPSQLDGHAFAMRALVSRGGGVRSQTGKFYQLRLLYCQACDCFSLCYYYCC